MSNPTLSNSWLSTNPDIPVRSTSVTSPGANLGKEIQHLRLDIGVAGAESQVSTVNPLPITGTVTPTPSTFAIAAETIVAASTNSQTLLIANASRKFASICNDSTAILRIRLSSTAASITTFTVALINQYDYYEVPAGYTGAITGIWASSTGSARITEG